MHVFNCRLLCVYYRFFGEALLAYHMSSSPILFGYCCHAANIDLSLFFSYDDDDDDDDYKKQVFIYRRGAGIKRSGYVG